jgi:hypothetical protein
MPLLALLNTFARMISNVFNEPHSKLGMLSKRLLSRRDQYAPRLFKEPASEEADSIMKHNFQQVKKILTL